MLAILDEKLINDNYIIEVGTNLDRKQGLRTHQALYEELVGLEEKVAKIDKRIKLLCKSNEVCQRILAIPGVGELTATAMIAAVPNANEFKNGRHMAQAQLGARLSFLSYIFISKID